MPDWLNRTKKIFGDEKIDKLKQFHVAVFGAGGVGGFAIEAISRGGVEKLHIVDNDIIDISNLNRQILATHDTIGRPKVEVAKERILSINPDATVTVSRSFVLPETIHEFDFSSYDYVVDAIDTVAGKLAIIEAAYAAGVPVISSMGTGNKTDPSLLTVTIIEKTETDPLARVMRHELKKRDIRNVKVVYSKETPVRAICNSNDTRTPGSTSFVPSACGILIASVVLKELMES